MFNKLLAAEAFKDLLERYKGIGPDYMEHAAKAVGRSKQTVKQYASSPTSKGHRTPTEDAIEALREGVMMRDVYRSAVGGVPFSVDLAPGVVGFKSYVIALDFADVRNAEVSKMDGGELPSLTDKEKLRHQWRQVAFGGIVDKSLLAEIAATDIYRVGWVGREHPKHGVQPTFEMVSRAIAAEALTNLGRKAA